MTTEYPKTTGPYFSAALICEKVLTEVDGSKSAIRIIDRLNRQIHGQMEMQPFEYPLTILIRFKSGSARGTMTLQIQVAKPSFESTPPIQIPVLFEGDEDRGVDVVLNLNMKFEHTGIYWFEVRLDNIFVTKIPLRIVYMPLIMQPQAGGGSQ
ncbi:MAG TPA: hypothetical protein VLH15_03295 [Dehalococcoidales bacterium]|nr:hypothetical protein [Dehalococcoidales bacterium]